MATILANIEVLLVVDAFGMEMTLGNILFASTYLVTDILSENHGKKDANKAVIMGTVASIFFVVTSQLWVHFKPAASDWASESICTVFSNTPRLILASLIVYLVTQIGDVWLYHKWWDITTKKLGDSRKGLWIRNNGSTIISQFFNSILFNVLAFYGVYSIKTLTNIVISTFVIYIITSLLDTPIVYWCRRMHDKHKNEESMK